MIKVPKSIQDKKQRYKALQALKKERELGSLTLEQITGKPLELSPNLNKPTTYNYKLKITGKQAETRYYTEPILTGYKRKHTPLRKEGRKMANIQNVKRARQNVYDIVNCNYTNFTKMLTLTYAKTQLDYNQLYLDFKHFRESLKRKGYDFPYLSITEHQTKRGKKEGNKGSLHIHALLFTDSYIPFKTIKESWGKRGSVHIEKIDDIENKGAYVSKYITKEGQIPDKKSYRTSRNIKRPTFRVGLGDEIDLISLVGKDYDFISQYDYNVDRGFNQETGEINQEIVCKVMKLKKTII